MGRKGEMLDTVIHSESLQEDIEIIWYLPESFSSVYKYHTCFMQDGNDYFQMGRIATLSDKLHEEGAIEPTVFVGIPYQDKYDRLDKYHPEGKKQEAYMNFLAHEVVPFFNQELPVFHMGGEPSRALMGDSLGGTVSFMTALKYPKLFQKVIMQSPYVDDHVLAAVEKAKNIDDLAIYHTIGNKETEVSTTSGSKEDFLSPNRRLHQQLKHINSLDYDYYELDGLHTWKYWQQDLPRAISTMFL